MSLVCLLCVPLIAFANIWNIKLQAGMSSDSDTKMKEANLLAGDLI
jgi:hypothetical protein